MGTRLVKTRILRDGERYLVELPSEWATLVVEQYDEIDAMVRDFDNSLILKPPGRFLTEMPRLKLLRDSPRELEAAVYSSYMRGYDGAVLEIPVQFTRSRRRLQDFSQQLYGVTPQPESATVVTLIYANDHEKRIPVILSRGLRILGDMNTQTEYCFDKFPRSRELTPHVETLAYLEDDSDRISLYSKRVLNRSLLHPESFEELGIRDGRDVIHYLTIIYNLERMGDLHKEIGRLLLGLSKKPEAKHLEISPIRQHYQKCFSFVAKARDCLRDPTAVRYLLEIEKRASEALGVEYFPRVYPLEDIQSLLRYIDGVETTIRRSLEIIQGKCWALIGNAINIAEALRDITIEYDSGEISESQSDPANSTQRHLRDFRTKDDLPKIGEDS